LTRYFSGLDEQIAHVVELHPYSSLDELNALAHKVEMQKKLKGKNPIPKPTSRPYGFQKPPYTPQKPSPSPNPKPSQTTTRQTPSKPPPKPPSKVRCFRCQGLWHYASECPNKRMVSLAEYQASLEELEDEEEKEEEEKGVYMTEIMEAVEEGPNEGELLVIGRALSGIVSHEGME